MRCDGHPRNCQRQHCRQREQPDRQLDVVGEAVQPAQREPRTDGPGDEAAVEDRPCELPEQEPQDLRIFCAHGLPNTNLQCPASNHCVGQRKQTQTCQQQCDCGKTPEQIVLALDLVVLIAKILVDEEPV